MLAKYLARSIWLPLLRQRHCETLIVPANRLIFLPHRHHNLLKVHNACSYLTVRRPWHLPEFRNLSNDRNWGGKESSADEDDDSEDSEFSDCEEVQDPPGYKNIELAVTSLRATTIANKALGLGTAKMKEAFYEGRIRLNKSRLLRKVKKAGEGDTIDIILEVSEENVQMQRVRVLTIGESSAKGNTKITIRRWKRLKLPRVKRESDDLG